MLIIMASLVQHRDAHTDMSAATCEDLVKGVVVFCKKVSSWVLQHSAKQLAFSFFFCLLAS